MWLASVSERSRCRNGYPHLGALLIPGGCETRVSWEGLSGYLWLARFWIPSLALLVTGAERNWLYPKIFVSVYCMLGPLLGASGNMKKIRLWLLCWKHSAYSWDDEIAREEQRLPSGRQCVPGAGMWWTVSDMGGQSWGSSKTREEVEICGEDKVNPFLPSKCLLSFSGSN